MGEVPFNKVLNHMEEVMRNPKVPEASKLVDIDRFIGYLNLLSNFTSLSTTEYEKLVASYRWATSVRQEYSLKCEHLYSSVGTVVFKGNI